MLFNYCYLNYSNTHLLQSTGSCLECGSAVTACGVNTDTSSY
uniref:Uncharacterized protein n=1 Tax=Anguilla anguilla TaxID=7936 RepID=A0A0E9QJG4_ANGAN